MNLSELMRKGAERYPQTKGDYFSYDGSGTCRGASSIGAAALGGGYSPTTKDVYAFLNTIPAKAVFHPVTGRAAPLAEVIYSLEDHWDWTIEQIASWLEQEGL